MLRLRLRKPLVICPLPEHATFLRTRRVRDVVDQAPPLTDRQRAVLRPLLARKK